MEDVKSTEAGKSSDLMKKLKILQQQLTNATMDANKAKQKAKEAREKLEAEILKKEKEMVRLCAGQN